MYRKDVNEQSPLRILDKSLHGGLGKGNLGVVMARAGVGKTTFLVQVGLDDAMRERPVLHITHKQTLEHLQGWYDALFEDLEKLVHLEDPQNARAVMSKNRTIQALSGQPLTPEHLEGVLSMYSKAGFKPEVIIIDGYDWELNAKNCGAHIASFKAAAKKADAELWMSAQTHREDTSGHPSTITAPCADHDDLIDVAIFLEPKDNHVAVRLLKDHGDSSPSDINLELYPDTMRLVSENDDGGALPLPASAYKLLSGGAPGAESAFGIAAEKWGVHETNFSFAGRKMERQVAVTELNESELHQGEVSMAYVESHLHRKFPKTDTFKKTLQTIWHQVATAGEVFVVGLIQDDNTVKGGTGWAAELAKHFHKPLFVFDQERRAWHTWADDAWKEVDVPKIGRKRFCGTGTRFLSDAGTAAIEALFKNSFGPAPTPKD